MAYQQRCPFWLVHQCNQTHRLTNSTDPEPWFGKLFLVPEEAVLTAERIKNLQTQRSVSRPKDCIQALSRRGTISPCRICPSGRSGAIPWCNFAPRLQARQTFFRHTAKWFRSPASSSQPPTIKWRNVNQQPAPHLCGGICVYTLSLLLSNSMKFRPCNQNMKGSCHQRQTKRIGNAEHTVWNIPKTHE